MEDEDPKGEKPNEEKPNENMDLDGEKRESGNQLPVSSQHNAADSVVQQEEEGADPLSLQNKSVKVHNKPVIVLSQFATPIGDGQWKAKLMPPQTDSGLINNLKTQNGGTVSPARSSKRSAATADHDSVDKATKLKAKKNLDSAPEKGKEPQPCSFISRDDSSLLNSAKSLGVVLGDNEQDILNSLKALRDIEGFRLVESKKLAEDNKVVVDDASTFCSNDDVLDLEALNLICSEISEWLGDGGCDPKCLQTPVSQKKDSRRQKKKTKNYSR
jgi:hypothetical protein